MFVSREKMGSMLQQAPDGQRESIVNEMLGRGYELEGLNAEFSFGETVTNIVPSAWEFGKNIVSVFADFPQTVESMTEIGKGALSKLIPGEQDSEKAFDAVIGMVQQRYGSKDKILNTIEEDPVGFLADLSTFIGGAGAVAGGIGKVGKIGALQKIGRAVRSASRVLEPTRAASAVVTKFNEVSGVNAFLRSRAERLGSKAITTSGATIEKLENKISMNPGIFLVKHKISGSVQQMSRALGDLASESRTLIDDGLSKINGLFTNRSIHHSLQAATKALRGLPDEELRTLRNEFIRLQEKHATSGITLSEVNFIKRRFFDDHSDLFKAVSGEGRPGLRKKSLRNLRKSLRGFIEEKASANGFKNVRELNKQTADTMVIKNILDSELKRNSVRSSLINSALNGIGFGTAGFAFINPGIALPLAGVIVSTKVIRSARFRTALANKLYLMSGGEFEKFASAISSTKPTLRDRLTIRNVYKSMQPLFPEIRLTGQLKEEVE